MAAERGLPPRPPPMQASCCPELRDQGSLGTRFLGRAENREPGEGSWQLRAHPKEAGEVHSCELRHQAPGPCSIVPSSFTDKTHLQR